MLQVKSWLETRNNTITARDSLNFPHVGLMMPGMGVNSLSGKANGASVVTPSPMIRLEGADATTDGQISHTLVKVAESAEDFFSQLNATMSGNGTYSVFSGSTGYHASETNNFHSQSTVVIATMSVLNALEFFHEGKLEDHAVQLAKNDPETFLQDFGDYYVQGILRGGYYFATVTILSESRDVQKEISGKVSASFEGFGKGSGSFSQEINSFNRFSDINIEFVQVGGTGPDHANLGSSFETLSDKINRFATTAYNHPVTMSVVASSYRSLDNFPRNPTSVFDRQNQLSQLAEYENQKSNISTMRNDLQFVQTHQNLFVNPPPLSKLNEWQRKLTDIQNKLETTTRTCSEDKTKCDAFSFHLPRDLKIPERIDNIIEHDESQKLGNIWIEKEGDWSGTWTRIGKSRLFEATWITSNQTATALLEIRIVGNSVQVLRTDSRGIKDGIPTTSQGDCHYMGTLGASGKVSGTYACPWGPPNVTLKWEAKIS